MKFPWNVRSLSGVKLDLIANLTGSAWTMLVQVACIPLYIRFLGIEAYGLIAFYLMFQAVVQVLDLGLSPTMNREMARYSVQPHRAEEARDLVRTLEVGYWCIGIIAGVALVGASSWVATHWIKAATIPVRSVKQAVSLMGILAIFQWPVSFYQGGLIGLRKQVLFNILRMIAVTVSNGGVVLVLWLVSATIQAFFLWLVVTNAIMALCWTVFLWRNLPRATRTPRFHPDLVRNIGRFAAGITGITAFSLILGQADKVVLSKVFNLTVFGYYTVAGVLGSGLVVIVTSVFNTIFPQFSALVAQGDEEAIIRLYHKATQLMLMLIVPLTSVLALFPVEVLWLWTRNADVARHAGPIASILIIAAAVNGLMVLPYTIQIAYGWTSIGLIITISLTAIVVPATWFMAVHYGAIGAAFVFLGIQVTNMLVGVPLTHRRVLRHEMGRWFLQDIGPPLAASVLVAGLARVIIARQLSPLPTLATLVLVLVATLAAAASFAPYIRGSLLAKLSSA